jgi:hypothetical protein
VMQKVTAKMYVHIRRELQFWYIFMVLHTETYI